MIAVEQGAGLRFRCRDVSKNFGALDVLSELNIEVAPGQFVALVGRSGSGKSTLLRLIAGLDLPTQGELFLDDGPIDGLSPQIRVMFQEARLLPWKRVIENVRLGLSRRDWQRAERALIEVGLEDRADEWPEVLSGGQKQRVALAHALAAEPRLLLLDEPLGALDALTRLEMQQLLERAWQEHGYTTILVTHDVEEAVALADRVVLLQEGHIVLDCPIPLPRPRNRDSAEFVHLRRHILDHLLN